MRGGIDEVEEALAAVEFGEEDGGVGLRIGGFDPVKAGPETALVATSFPEDSARVTACPHRHPFCFFLPSFLKDLNTLTQRKRSFVEYIIRMLGSVGKWGVFIKGGWWNRRFWMKGMSKRSGFLKGAGVTK